MSRPTDIELFQRIQEGDKKALETLFGHYYNTLCNFSHVITKSQELAEEVVSDVFYNIWINAEHLQIEKDVKSYLFASVKYQSFRVLKQKELHFEALSETIANGHINPIDPERMLLYDELHDKY